MEVFAQTLNSEACYCFSQRKHLNRYGKIGLFTAPKTKGEIMQREATMRQIWQSIAGRSEHQDKRFMLLTATREHACMIRWNQEKTTQYFVRFVS